MRRELRGEGSAGVLISEDSGSTWSVHAHVQAPETWLIENTLAELASGAPAPPAHPPSDGALALLPLAISLSAA